MPGLGVKDSTRGLGVTDHPIGDNGDSRNLLAAIAAYIFPVDTLLQVVLVAA
jgi:hypothetical protein